MNCSGNDKALVTHCLSLPTPVLPVFSTPHGRTFAAERIFNVMYLRQLYHWEEPYRSLSSSIVQQCERHINMMLRDRLLHRAFSASHAKLHNISHLLFRGAVETYMKFQASQAESIRSAQSSCTASDQ
ncbi:uncharacterized protein LAESUDRAFT_430474 [Laetiporus sulphureus 93-53]|uniref:Uncharacterized protein n=1 Tax=Laetiporus sulphureus 93-53 TaxID=1314785 RepID=A0A165GMY1_9APHY|nr:uncharacterized protein LAESUDRAFT_430474 [Laetiporus sulphureus 93-53]KZT10570.1 hypothetical protein LAESUDRAFT_430474 [Laetiporus sulphureus 93-53]